MPELNDPQKPLALKLRETAVPRPPAQGACTCCPICSRWRRCLAGFYAIVMAMNGRFESGCIGVFCAMVLDSLDGRVARMTNTQSAFGEQMDSLSRHGELRRRAGAHRLRMGARGIGQAGLDGRLRLLSLALRLRLARFNTNIGVVDKRYFQGLPSPAAAALVVGFIWVMDDAGLQGRRGSLRWLAWSAFVVTLLRRPHRWSPMRRSTASRIVSLKKSVPFVVIVAIALGASRSSTCTRPRCCSASSASTASRAMRCTPGARARASR
jgi:CDP-diacylglycerol--serine O-phosphatidyltransferase